MRTMMTKGLIDASLLAGIVGDGETDCTDALQDALTKYRHVYLPPGTYVVRCKYNLSPLDVGETLHLPSNTVLSGAGRATTIEFHPGLNEDPGLPVPRLIRGIAIVDAENVMIRDLALHMTANKRTGQAEQGHAIFGLRSSHVTVRDIWVNRCQDGDGVYFGHDTRWLTIDSVHVRNAGRCAVTVEGDSDEPREGISIKNITRDYTEDSDPTQRRGRLVDVEVSGAGLRGLRIEGCYAPYDQGGIEAVNVHNSIIVNNIASRLAIGGRRNIFANNILHNTQSQATFSASRANSCLVANNWMERDETLAPEGVSYSLERNLPGNGTDIMFVGNRVVRGTPNVRAVDFINYNGLERDQIVSDAPYEPPPVPQPPTVVAVTVDDYTVTVGDTVTPHVVTESEEADGAVTLAYRYILNDVPISGATASSHTTANAGELRIGVIATNSVGSSAEVLSPAIAVATGAVTPGTSAAIRRPSITADYLETADTFTLPSGNWSLVLIFDITQFNGTTTAPFFSYGFNGTTATGLRLSVSTSTTPDRLQIRYYRDVSGTPTLQNTEVVLTNAPDITTAGRVKFMVTYEPLAATKFRFRATTETGAVNFIASTNTHTMSFAPAAAPIRELESARGAISWALLEGIVSTAQFDAMVVDWDAPRQLSIALGLTRIASRVAEVADGQPLNDNSVVVYEGITTTAQIVSGNAHLTGQEEP